MVMCHTIIKQMKRSLALCLLSKEATTHKWVYSRKKYHLFVLHTQKQSRQPHWGQLLAVGKRPITGERGMIVAKRHLKTREWGESWAGIVFNFPYGSLALFFRCTKAHWEWCRSLSISKASVKTKLKLCGCYDVTSLYLGGGMMWQRLTNQRQK